MKEEKFIAPNFIIPFKNPDKEFQEKPSSDLMMFPHASRILFFGTPSSGKSTCILNCILHQNFDRIIVVHNLKNTKEYDMLDVEYYTEVPDPDDEELALDPSIKNLIIFEDLYYKCLPKQQKIWLTDYFTTISTHSSVSCYISCQDIFHQVPTNLRRCCNVFVIFKILDKRNLSNICEILNLDLNDMKFIFNKYLTQPFDNITIDTTRPNAKIRKNFTQVLEI